MAFRGYILIEAEVGHAKAVGDAVHGFNHPDARVLSVDTVTGPFDVIVQMEADDLDKLGAAEVDLLTLKAAKLVGQLAQTVKVIKTGELTKKVALKGIGATAGAKAAIEAAGGSVAE